MEINLRGKGELEKKIEIDLLSAQVGNNQFKIDNLEFDKDLKITNFQIFI